MCYSIKLTHFLILPISTACILVGCASPVVTVRKDVERETTEVSYSDFWSAFRYGDEKQMQSLAYMPEQHSFARAFTYGKQRRWREAATLLDSLQCATINDTVRHLGSTLLRESRRILELWDEMCVDSCVSRTDTAHPCLACLYAQKPPVSITFGRDADTIPLCVKRGIPMVSVMLNGKEYEFIFDTGAQQTAVYGFSARESAVRVLEEVAYRVGSSTGSIYNAHAGLINSLSIAGAQVTHLPCYIFDAERLETTWLFFTTFSCDGVLGWDVIKHLDVTIDYPKSRLIVRHPQKKVVNNQAPSLLWVEHPLVSAKTVGGLPLWFVFDSGASRSSLVADIITQKIPDLPITESQRTVTTIGGKEKQDIYEADNFSFYLSHYRCTIKPIALQKERGGLIAVDGVLGSDIFQEGVVHIDYTNGIFEFVAEQKE